MGCPGEAEGFLLANTEKKGSSSTCGDLAQLNLGMGCDGEGNPWSTEPPASQERGDARIRCEALDSVGRAGSKEHLWELGFAPDVISSLATINTSVSPCPCFHWLYLLCIISAALCPKLFSLAACGVRHTPGYSVQDLVRGTKRQKRDKIKDKLIKRIIQESPWVVRRCLAAGICTSESSQGFVLIPLKAPLIIFTMSSSFLAHPRSLCIP